MIAYAIQTKNGGVWLGGIRDTRSECVKAWTGGMFKSENCNAWKKAKSIGLKIVRVTIDVV